MKTRLIAVILDLSPKYPTRAGQSHLQKGQEELLKISSKLESDDKVLINNFLCKTPGQFIHQVSNHKPKPVKLVKTLSACLEQCFFENHDVYVLILTDNYKQEELPVERGHYLNTRCNDFRVFLCQFCEDLNLDAILEEIFARNDEHLLDMSDDCSPLTF